MPLLYDAADFSLFQATLRIGHTVIPYIWANKAFWLFLIIHLCLWFFWQSRCYTHMPGLADYADEEGVFFLAHSSVVTLNAMAVFFLVFYTDGCYGRYLQLAAQVQELFQSCHRFCFSLKALLANQEDFFLFVMRHVRITLVIFLAYTKQEEVNDTVFEELEELGLLTKDERDHLSGYTPQGMQQVLMDWITRGLLEGFSLLETGSAEKSPAMLRLCIFEMLSVDDAQTRCLQTVRMPYPFPYFQLLNLMVSINLFSWGYCMSRMDSIFGPVVYFCVSFVFVGMLEMANMFSNPLGEDEVDFDIFRWLGHFLKNQTAFMECDYPGGKEKLANMAHPDALNNHNEVLTSQELDRILYIIRFGSASGLPPRTPRDNLVDYAEGHRSREQTEEVAEDTDDDDD